MHRFLYESKKDIFETISRKRNIIFINQTEISTVLSKISLYVSDFSSAIFDVMYRKKPIIFFIPDMQDNNIRNIYTKDYYFLIEKIRNKTINLENLCMTASQTVDKIIYYIKRNFTLDDKLKKFYKSFDLRKGKNTNMFIKKLINIT